MSGRDTTRLVGRAASLIGMKLTALSGHSTVVSALDTSQVKTLGLGAVVAVIVVGLVISYLVTKIVTRIIVIALVVVLGFAVYNQRSRVLDGLDKSAKKCDVTFFGVHVQPSDPQIKKACLQLSKTGH